MTTAELFEKVRVATSDSMGDGVTRPSYGFMETKAIKTIEHEALSRDLIPTYDAAGNLWISIAGCGGIVPAELGQIDCGWEPYVLMGSHVDSVANGGNYDGLAGVIAGLEVLTRLRDERPRPRVRVIALRGEESAWFGAPYKGAKALFGKFDSEEIRDTVAQEAAGHSRCLGDLGRPLIRTELVKAFLELHIEQGPELEERGSPIAPVSSIRGNVRLAMSCFGRPDHSGTTPMHLRKDAVSGAAAAVRAIEHVCVIAAGHREQRDLVGTCGVFNTLPTASASKIAEQVDFTVEFRSDRAEHLVWAMELYQGQLDHIERTHRVKFVAGKRVETTPVNLVAMAQVYDPVIQAVKETIGFEATWAIPSGAGHDAAVFAAHGIPAGMIFVRNQNGSHNPGEAMRMADFELGVDALERAVRRLM